MNTSNTFVQQAQAVHEKLEHVRILYAKALEQTLANTYETIMKHTYEKATQALEREAERLDRLIQGLSNDSPHDYDGYDDSHFQLLRILSDVDSIPNDSLIPAIKTENFPLFSFLVQVNTHIPVNLSEHNNLAINIASERGLTEFVRLLLQDPTVDPQLDALKSACENGHHDVVRLLLQDERKRAKPSYKMLRSACDCGHIEVVRVLLDMCNIKDPPSISDELSAFGKAVVSGNEQLVRLFYPDKIGNEDLNYSFVLACMHGQDHIALLLMSDSRVDPSYNNNQAMINACGYGHYDTVRLLLQDPRVDTSVGFRVACEEDHMGIVELLLDDKLGHVDPSVYNDYELQHSLIMNDVEDVFRMLLPLMSEVQSGLLLTAIDYGCVDVVKMLLEDGRVNPAADYNNAIRWASTNGHTEIVRLLLQDPRVDPADDNNVAIRYASEEGHTEIVRLLLAWSNGTKRVDPSADNNYALRYAIKNNHTAIVQMLSQDPRTNASA